MKKVKTIKKEWNRICARECFLRMACQPACILVYVISWRYLYSLCMYGRIRRNLPILAVCLTFWLGYLVLFLMWSARCRKNTAPLIYDRVSAQGEKLVFGKNDYETEIGLEEVKHYRIRKKRLYLMAKGGRFYVSQYPWDEAEGDYLRLKLSSCGLLRRFFWSLPGLACLAAATLCGAAGVVHSGIPYNGKLSWFLEDLQNTRRVTLKHGNVMETGMDGVLEDIRRTVKLPEKLCLVSGFNLHFGPDGTIRTLDAFVNGYDKEGRFVDSYLISYDERKSDRLRIDLHGSTGGEYEEDKDFGRLVEALRVIPIRTLAAKWNQEEYGILYYGERTWNTWDDNVIYINAGREIMDAQEVYRQNQEHTGYSISIFCPEDESIPPYRYLYVTDEEWAELEGGQGGEKTDGWGQEDGKQDSWRQEVWDHEGEKQDREGLESGPDGKQDGGGTTGTGLGSQPAGSAQDITPVGIHGTGNQLYLSDYKAEDYGTVDKKEWENENGERVFLSSLERYYIDEKYDFAEKANAVLEGFYLEKEREMEDNERKYSIDQFLMDRWGLSGKPYQKVSFLALTCADDQYISVVFMDNLYTGGAHPFTSLIGITIDPESGRQVDVLEAAVTESFLAVQGVEGFQGYTDYNGNEIPYRTAGEEWYRLYEEGGSGNGFYVTRDKIYMYFGSEQIAARPQGFPEVGIDR